MKHMCTLRVALLGLLFAILATPQARATATTTVTLADQPIFAASNVPGNMALTLSVEYPTANSVANLNDYADTSTSYLGYFDPLKCYNYVSNGASSYFQPASLATGTNKHTCSGAWSGNFMNWATMQTIDPFRWALSGGYRSQDDAATTVIEKAWASGQGGTSNYPDRGTRQGTGNKLASSLVPSVTPFGTWSDFNLRIEGNGNRMVFNGSSSNTSYQNSGLQTDLPTTIPSNPSTTTAYQVYIRVKVCDPTTTLGTAGLEGNCKQYGNNYKPEGLLQQYSNQIRFSAFGYLNGDGATRQGGVLRESMGYIGPTYPQPLSSAVTTNSRAEWSASTGQMIANPDPTLASASGVTRSGVINYLNGFGESSQKYMVDDNVSELYYAAIRYFENRGNVPEWTNSMSTTELDGFPAATTWSDPILYACQKNFILGIGDDHTHVDYNVGTGANPSSMVATGSRGKPALVSSDPFNMAAQWTANLQSLEGITQTPWWALGAGQATYYIAGLAYGAHVLDIRADLTGSQTISTYWMDVMEYQHAENLNPYYLATKYGGFSVPPNYSISNTTALPTSEWDTTGNSINMNGTSHLQPDNYFLAGNANQMVTGLKSAFTNISNAIKAYTTSFSTSTSVIGPSGTLSFATQYDPSNWTGVITASTLTFAGTVPQLSTVWVSSTTLQTQFANTGWDSGRRIATWSGSAGVAFRSGSLSSSQLAALTPSYSTGTTAAQYLSYLRGDQTNEIGSTASGSSQSLRSRKLLLGDIVDAKLVPVGPPNDTYSESYNTGYTSFKSSWASRPLVVYAGSNDGMLHALLGSNGTEQFAYVPSALFQGPNSTPQVDGLAQLGSPNYSHHYYVDATPQAFNVDLGNAGGHFGSPNWRTILVGGLGKGGRSYYAIDVTDPAGMTSEATVAGNIKWEFTDSTLGYSYGTPLAFKTAKYGWVIALTSGYNNSDGYGYLYLLDPGTGTLLEKIKTPSASSGLTQANAYLIDYSDFTADSVYVGDLNGQLWRFGLSGARGSGTPYPAPALLATLTDGSGNAQPVTSAPAIAIYPLNRRRYVLLGTGKLLASGDINSSQVQTFYAIVDGNQGAYSAAATPLTRSNLQPVTDVTVGLSSSTAANGWYYDLGSSSGSAYEVILSPTTYNGAVLFSALQTQGDACSPTGTSRVYVLDYGTAKSDLTGNVPYVSSSSAVVNQAILSNNGTVEAVYGTQTGGPPVPLPANLGTGVATRLLNWREVPTIE